MRILKILGIAGVSMSLLSANVAFAEDTQMDAPQDVRGEVMKRVDAVTESIKEFRVEKASTAAQSRLKAVREEAHKTIEAAREEAKQKVEAVRADIQARVEAVREEAKTRLEAQREKASERLADIKDEAKKRLAENMTGRFDHLNKTWTDHFLELLGRYDEILQKMRDRADVAAGAGRDVTAAHAAIQSAETALESARAAVVAQAAKTYALDTSAITTAAATTTPSGQAEFLGSLRATFQELHAALFKDLFALRDGPMKDVRSALQSALQSLSAVPDVDEENTAATTTGNQ